MTWERDRDICRSKRQYSYEEANLEVALNYGRLSLYHCPLCFAYHLTSKGQSAEPE